MNSAKISQELNQQHSNIQCRNIHTQIGITMWSESNNPFVKCLSCEHEKANREIISIKADESFDTHSVIDEITQLGHTLLRLWMRTVNDLSRASRYFSFSLKCYSLPIWLVSSISHSVALTVFLRMHLSNLDFKAYFAVGPLLCDAYFLFIQHRNWVRVNPLAMGKMFLILLFLVVCLAVNIPRQETLVDW